MLKNVYALKNGNSNDEKSFFKGCNCIPLFLLLPLSFLLPHTFRRLLTHTHAKMFKFICINVIPISSCCLSLPPLHKSVVEEQHMYSKLEESINEVYNARPIIFLNMQAKHNFLFAFLVTRGCLKICGFFTAWRTQFSVVCDDNVLYDYDIRGY
jgi:hypothetical protein